MLFALSLLLVASPSDTERLLARFFSVHSDGVLHLVPVSGELLAPVGAGEVVWFGRSTDEAVELALASAESPEELYPF